jgi:hypothetical protein
MVIPAQRAHSRSLLLDSLLLMQAGLLLMQAEEGAGCHR